METYKQLITKNLQGQFDSFNAMFELAFGEAVPLTLEVADFGSMDSTAAYYATERKVVFNLADNLGECRGPTIAHEVSHWLCRKWSEDFRVVDGEAHSFDFGVLCALLSCRMGVRKNNFFRAYDFHEDYLYPWLMVNPHSFDQLIKNTPVRSLDDLAAQTFQISSAMRTRARALRDKGSVAITIEEGLRVARSAG